MRYFLPSIISFLAIQAVSLGAMEIGKLQKVPSLKWQCIKAICDHQAKVPNLYDKILYKLPQEISLLLVANIGDFDFALHYATCNDIDQDVADFIVENTQDLIQKVINDPSLQSVFLERMLAEENNNYLAWALYRRFLESQVGIEYPFREAPAMQGTSRPQCYDNQLIEKVLEEKSQVASAEIWHKAIRCYLAKAEMQERNHKVFEMILSDENGNQKATFKKYPASLEGEVFIDENNTMLLLSGKIGFKYLASAQLGLQIFRLHNIYPHAEGGLGKIEAAYFSDDLQKVLFETEGNTFEFTIPTAALDFIRNINAESAASLLVLNSLEKLVLSFSNSELRSEQEYQPLHENIQKMLHADAVLKSEYLQERYKSQNDLLEGIFEIGPQRVRRRVFVPSLPEIIVGVAIGGVFTVAVYKWLMQK